MNFFKNRRILAALVLFGSILTWQAVAETPAIVIPIPNFHQVNEHVYRGGQPSPDTWQQLAKIGVKTVIDLRREGEEEHSVAQEAEAVKKAGMTYVNVPMKGVVAPTDDQITKVLALLNTNEPVFVHCKRGSDRTGAVIACYRISHDRWQQKQALQEAKSHGMALFQVGLKRYIMTYQPSM